MSYINFDYENNSILISKGKRINFNKIELAQCFNDFNIYSFEGQFDSIEIPNFLDFLEQEGIKGELRFKELLEKNNVPYLYIGQGPFGIERFDILLDKTKAKRADFLVNIRNLGTILFDVKSRSKKSFHNSGEEKFFSISIKEIIALNNLQETVLMPVWLAFIDRESLNKESPTFYFISISSLVNFWKKLQPYFGNQEEYSEITMLRIPNELFTKIDNRIFFEIGYQDIDESILEKFAIYNTGLIRRIKDDIKNIVRRKECVKSKIFIEFETQGNFYCHKMEVDFILQKMIETKHLIYEPRKPLRIFGE